MIACHLFDCLLCESAGRDVIAFSLGNSLVVEVQATRQSVQQPSQVLCPQSPD